MPSSSAEAAPQNLSAGEDDYARLLTLYPMLAALPEQARQSLFEATQPVFLPAGSIAFDEHQPCMGFPLILEGVIRITKRAANGRELPLYRVTPGDSCIISSSCLVGHSDYRACAVVESDARLRLLPTAAFDAWLAEPAFRAFVFSLFAERMAELMQIVEEVAFHKLDQRLASRLLGRGSMLKLTHQQLADELGSVREMVSRILKNFAEQGLVRLGREQIEILDPAGLRRVSGAD